MVYNKNLDRQKNNLKTEIHAYFKKITLFNGFIIVMLKFTCMPVILTLRLSQINVEFRILFWYFMQNLSFIKKHPP